MVIGCLFRLCALVLGVGWLFSFGLAPTPTEQRWNQALKAPSEAAGEALDESTHFRLSCTACFGFCPMYRLTVSGSSLVTFVGEECVCGKHPPTAHIDPREVNEFMQALRAAGFPGSLVFEGDCPTDVPIAALAIESAGEKVSVEFPNINTASARYLRRVADQVGAMAQSAMRVGEVRDGFLHCVNPDGSSRREEWAGVIVL